MTTAGRTTRSCRVNPRSTSCTTVIGGCSAVCICCTAWWRFGSKGFPAASIGTIWCRLSAASICFATMRTPSTSLSVLLDVSATASGPVQVVERGQQVARQAARPDTDAFRRPLFGPACGSFAARPVSADRGCSWRPVPPGPPQAARGATGLPLLVLGDRCRSRPDSRRHSWPELCGGCVFLRVGLVLFCHAIPRHLLDLFASASSAGAK